MWRRIALVAMAALALAGCQTSSGGTPSQSGSKPKIAFIIYSTPIEFFVPTVQGIHDAAAAFGVDVNIEYGNGDNIQENNLIVAAIAKKVDGIAVSLPDNNAFAKSVCDAKGAGIPVVSFNIDATSGPAHDCRMAFMGQDFQATGYLIAKRMIADHGIKSGDKLFCPVELPEATYAVQRFAGVKKALDEVGASCDLVGTGFTLSDVQTKEVQYLLGHRDTKAIIALGSSPLTVAPKAIIEAGVKIPMGGFDLTSDIIKGIQGGVITATVDQAPYSQGYYPVAQLALAIKYGLYPSDMNTGGNGLIDKSNVAKVAALTGKVR